MFEALKSIRDLMAPLLVDNDDYAEMDEDVRKASRAARRAIRHLDEIGEVTTKFPIMDDYSVPIVCWLLSTVLYSANLALSFSMVSYCNIEHRKKVIALNQAFVAVMDHIGETECPTADPRLAEDADND